MSSHLTLGFPPLLFFSCSFWPGTLRSAFLFSLKPSCLPLSGPRREVGSSRCTSSREEGCPCFKGGPQGVYFKNINRGLVVGGGVLKGCRISFREPGSYCTLSQGHLVLNVPTTDTRCHNVYLLSVSPSPPSWTLYKLGSSVRLGEGVQQRPFCVSTTMLTPVSMDTS